MVALRPALALLGAGDERLELALKGELEFWNRLDRLRLKVYERAVRPYIHHLSAPVCSSRSRRRVP
jgi:hypothetical protein